MKLIFIKFNSDLHKDGLGAQLQRQVATFCLAQYLHINFLPSEINFLDFNPGDGITNAQAQESLLAVVNRNLDSNKTKTPNVEKAIDLKLVNPPTTLWKLKIWFALLRFRQFFSSTDIIYAIDDPYIFINQNVNLYKKAKHFKFILENPFSNNTKSFNVALHIPRAKVSPKSLPERYQPTEWYLKTLDKSLMYLGMERKFVNLYIHTDSPAAPSDWEYANKSSSESQEYWRKAGILNETGRMTLNFEDFNTSFTGFFNLTIIRDVDPITAWQNISHCDVFILGKSSFSFIGALFNNHGLKISPVFFIEPPNNWILIPDEGGFSLRDRIRLVRMRVHIFKLYKELKVKA